MDKQRVLGLALVFGGIISISSSTFGMTGAVIGMDFVEFAGTFIGLAFVMAGCVVLMGGKLTRNEISDFMDEGDEIPFQRMDMSHKMVRPGSRGNNAAKNREARYWMRLCYLDEKGYSPNRKQLKGYVREHHEKGDIYRMVKSIRERYKQM